MTQDELIEYASKQNSHVHRLEQKLGNNKGKEENSRRSASGSGSGGGGATNDGNRPKRHRMDLRFLSNDAPAEIMRLDAHEGTVRRLIQVDSGANVHGSNDDELKELEPFRHDVHGVDQRAIRIEERGQLHFTINAKDRETGSPILVEVSIGNVLKLPSMTPGHTLLSVDELAQKGIGFSVLPQTKNSPVKARMQTIAWTSDMIIRNGAFYVNLADE